jgi:chromate reductase, NAD(P)H dehydrogenase (quinone)
MRILSTNNQIMKLILAICASNKPNSINRLLLSAACLKLSGAEVQTILLSEVSLPFYNELIEENDGVPGEVLRIHQIFSEADGFILACAEHNGLPPASFKNLYDWLSRINQKVFADKPVMLLSTSPGEKGGASNLSLIRELLPRWGGIPAGFFALGKFHSNFHSSKKRITNPLLNLMLDQEIAVFESAIHDPQFA